MKKLLIFLFLTSGFASHANEGVSTVIDPSRLNEVMEWVENSKYTLDTEIENIQRSTVTEQERGYETLLAKLLRQSQGKVNEFLMRNLLERVQIVYLNLKQAPPSARRDAIVRRVLEEGVEWARRLYQPDINLISMARQGTLTETLRGVEFARLGVEWAEYMLSLYYLAPNTKTRMQLMTDMMGIMYNDIMNDDAVNRILAPVAGAFATKNGELKAPRPIRKGQQLILARRLRAFMEQQLVAAKSLLNTYRNVRADNQSSYYQQVGTTISRMTVPVTSESACQSFYKEVYAATYLECAQKAVTISYNSPSFASCFAAYKESYTTPYALSKCERKVSGS